jgi:opacity protein-like surface antigen
MLEGIMKCIVTTALIVIVWATPALAQDAPQPFVRGFGGMTFMTETAGIFGGSVGVRFTRHVDVFGEFGGLTNILPRSLQEDLDAAARAMGTFFGGPLTIDGRAPGIYGLGGLRLTHAAGSRMGLFAEGGAGVAHGVSDITARAGSTDVSREVTAALRIKQSETRLLLAVGGGVTLPLTDRLALDLGYRYMRIFTDDPRINTGTMSAGVHWGF